MSGDLDKEILMELKKINEKLDAMNEPRGLSTSMKVFAFFFGGLVVAPIVSFLFILVSNWLN